MGVYYTTGHCVLASLVLAWLFNSTQLNTATYRTPAQTTHCSASPRGPHHTIHQIWDFSGQCETPFSTEMVFLWKFPSRQGPLLGKTLFPYNGCAQHHPHTPHPALSGTMFLWWCKDLLPWGDLENTYFLLQETVLTRGRKVWLNVFTNLVLSV